MKDHSIMLGSILRPPAHGNVHTRIQIAVCQDPLRPNSPSWNGLVHGVASTSEASGPAKHALIGALPTSAVDSSAR